MNDRYIDYGESSNFPEDAFDMVFNIDGPIEFNNDWLQNADDHEQRTALIEWFTARYCDPAQETPYNGREGGYLFVHGGPFSPDEKLRERFEGLVSDDILEEAIEELEDIAGEEWAPISHDFIDEDYFDPYYEIEITNKEEPKKLYTSRTCEIFSLIDEKKNSIHQQMIYQMAYGMLISCAEALISDTVIYWAKSDEQTLFRLASKECTERSYKLSEVLNDIEKFKETFINHLTSNIVWHRLDKLKPTIEHGLKIKMPEIGIFLGAIQTRHDIVHRAGKTKTGNNITLTKDELKDLKSNLDKFVNEFTTSIENSYKK